MWCVDRAAELTSPPLDKLGPEAATIEPDELPARFARAVDARSTGSCATSAASPGSAGASPTRCCHRAKLSPFAMTGKLGRRRRGRRSSTAIREAVADGLEYERTRDDMSSSKDRPGRVHGRTGEPCPVCGDTIRAVEYSGYTVNYCPTCQTGGKVLADNTTSKFLK